eukprot:5659135-Amphidinium_carterae.1
MDVRARLRAAGASWSVWALLLCDSRLPLQPRCRVLLAAIQWKPSMDNSIVGIVFIGSPADSCHGTPVCHSSSTCPASSLGVSCRLLCAPRPRMQEMVDSSRPTPRAFPYTLFFMPDHAARLKCSENGECIRFELGDQDGGRLPMKSADFLDLRDRTLWAEFVPGFARFLCVRWRVAVPRRDGLVH